MEILFMALFGFQPGSIPYKNKINKKKNIYMYIKMLKLQKTLNPKYIFYFPKQYIYVQFRPKKVDLIQKGISI